MTIPMYMFRPVCDCLDLSISVYMFRSVYVGWLDLSGWVLRSF